MNSKSDNSNISKYQRTNAQIREHYEVEKELAEKLLNSTRQERQTLYAHLYDELFKRIPHHPQLLKKLSQQEKIDQVAFQMRNLQPFLSKNMTFLEIGAGDCALSCEVAKYVKQVYAVDISKEIVRGLSLPRNIELILSDGCNIPVPAESVNVAYSYQLMEHLHPDDAREQLYDIYKALIPGGCYFCITPNRINGPHDISRYFDSIATGFHLKEYTNAELHYLFKEVGFSKVQSYIRIKNYRKYLSPVSIELCEKMLGVFPYSVRKFVASSLPIAILLGIQFIGTK
jgi:SAM-dependent methyltransferase